MREVLVPVVLIIGWKEEPIIKLFDEETTEEDIVRILAVDDGWMGLGDDDIILPKTMKDFNKIQDYDFQLSFLTIKVFD